MNPTDLVSPRIVDYCRPLNLILIIGAVKSGKVTIARKLASELDRILLISDDYIERYGQHDALNYLEQEMNDYYYSATPIIVEGILGFRLLRRMIKNGYHLPDMVIKTECSEETIRYFYSKEDPNKNMNSVIGFNNGLEKIYRECLDLIKLQNRSIKQLTLNTSIF